MGLDPRDLLQGVGRGQIFVQNQELVFLQRETSL